MKFSDTEILDPVAAYEQIAPFFSRLAERRRRYLESVDAHVVARVPRGSQSLLDVGAGDGKRTMRIAAKSGIRQVVLLEPSFAMSRSVAGTAEVWRIRAEALPEQADAVASRRFDVITCLWNVLGHIRPAAMRAGVMQQLARTLSPEGLLFLDVNYRYNLRAYGALPTAARFLYDMVRPGEQNGDVTVTWEWKEVRYHTYGHFFTHSEVMTLAHNASLALVQRVVIDYGSGQTRRFGWEGSLLYVFRRSSSNDIASRSHTS
jgi:2-polyprenyl-3-methyl-5-hydroxy-6-metoxy-1,4-benzoquinol methylase